ncbi:MAG: hypothetical protein JWR42_2471, partial [Marmoricola sp.]|nr:hypothetical protein [Marmoricola sp.]
LLSGDPRVVTRGDRPALAAALASPARVLVELHQPWLLEPAAWRALLRGSTHGSTGVLTHLGPDSGPVATSTALRLVRRARRWGASDPPPVTVDLPGEPLPPSLTPESWWGGWGPGAPRG